VSNTVAQELVSVGVIPDKIRIIPNGVDLTEFRPGYADRDGLGLPVWSENKDEIRDFNDCVAKADDDAARDRCSDQFEQELDRNN
jgi:hypothetical protein